MNDYKPPFHITDKMTSLIAEISEQVGRITVLQEGAISPNSDSFWKKIPEYEYVIEYEDDSLKKVRDAYNFAYRLPT